MDESRFDRLEQKIDKLTDAVTKIVRVEEQLISNNKRLDRVEQRVDVLEKNGFSQFTEKLFWIAVAAVVSAGIWWSK